MAISVWENDDHVAISVEGRFDFNLHQAFRAAYRNCDGSSTRFSVDLGDVQYLDSSALGMLLLLREHAGGDGRKVALCNCNPPVKELLKLARFDRLFTLI